MSQSRENAPAPAPQPSARRGSWPRAVVLLLSLAATVLGGWAAKDRVLRAARGGPRQELAALSVDQGDVPVVVIESGALESANNATVKCKVEALMGQVGGAQPKAGGAPAGGGASAPSAAATKAAAPVKGSDNGVISSSTGMTANSSVTSAGGAVGGGGGGGGAAPAAGGASGGGGSTAPVAPTITSFTYVVAPHIPLRPATTTSTQAKAAAAPAAAPAGGGGGGGGNRGGGNQQQQATKPGSTRILTILPEGTRVKEGDVVCELDSSAFSDEVAAQLIRHAQAKAWVEQARAILEVNDIALREYRDGIYREDLGLVDSYIEACKLECKRAAATLEWSRGVSKKRLRTPAQLRGDVLTMKRAEIALAAAEGMKHRLVDFTAPKIIKSLEAKGEAIRADKFAQEAAFGLEDDRLRRLQTMVENCTMRATRDGIVVYANAVNGWGRVDTQITEGLTVREGMPIFNLPDPTHMRVRAKVNESKVVAIKAGQDVDIRLDAFPDRPLRGKVAEVTPIPAPANGPISDVKIYYAMIDIEGGGSSDLRPGFSARVGIAVGRGRSVTRIPVEAVRWVGATPYAAKLTPAGPRWAALDLGLSNSTHAEVRAGLEPGDRVAADPESLPPPPPNLPRPATVAEGWKATGPRG